MSFALEALIAYLIIGVIGGTASEQIAKRKAWPPLGLIGAILVAFGGGLIGAWFFADILRLFEPRIFSIPIIGTLIGLVLFLAPYFAVRAGFTSYGKQRTWQRKYRR